MNKEIKMPELTYVLAGTEAVFIIAYPEANKNHKKDFLIHATKGLEARCHA